MIVEKPKSRSSRPTQAPAEQPPTAIIPPWYASAWALAAVSGLLLYAAFPPLDLWLLAWLAPLGWLWVIQRPQLPGQFPLLGVYLLGVVHWLALVHWIRLPHWSAAIGWPVLAAYLGTYLWAFVVLSRVLVHRVRLPLYVAAPLVWIGLELVRGYLLGGFSMALLGHTQYRWLHLIQVADIGGAYAVSFLVVLSASSVIAAVDSMGEAPRWRSLLHLLPAAILLPAALIYGGNRLSAAGPAEGDQRQLRVALIQGSIDTRFDIPPGEEPPDELTHYAELSIRAVREHPDLELLIWPESMYSRLYAYYQQRRLPSAKAQQNLDEAKSGFERRSGNFTRRYLRSKSLLVGTPGFRFVEGDRQQRMNLALLISGEGRVVDLYAKMHPVIFGEYVPLGEVFPQLYRLTPMGAGLAAGDRAEAFNVGGLRLSPSICYENTVPHLIRRQVYDLQQRGTPPDVLVTLSNDGWFWGSSELDLHLICGVFRAVECRRPALIAANTGISAHIDASGRILARGPKRQTDVLAVTVRPDRRESHYVTLGDLFAYVGLAACLVATFVGVHARLGGKTRPGAE